MKILSLIIFCVGVSSLLKASESLREEKGWLGEQTYLNAIKYCYKSPKSINELLNQIYPKQLEIIRNHLAQVPTTQPHTKFGMGLRFRYPDSEARNKLKEMAISTKYKPVFFKEGEYNPVRFIAEGPNSPSACVWGVGKAAKDAWADPSNSAEIEAQIELGRKRITGPYNSADKTPFRTGIAGLGELGLYGKNPASDLAIFCFIENILHVLLIYRDDRSPVVTDSLWALPGGMCDPTDLSKNATARRELSEETGVSVESLISNKLLTEFGEIYDGYSDDVRNTDDAYMWTTAYGYVLDSKALTKEFLELLERPTEEAFKSRMVPVDKILTGKVPVFAGHQVIIANGVRKLFYIAAEAELSASEREDLTRQSKKRALEKRPRASCKTKKHERAA